MFGVVSMGGGASVNANAEASEFANYRDRFHKVRAARIVSSAREHYKQRINKNATRILQDSVD